MPSLRWYVQRARALSPMEVPWRAWRLGRTLAGRARRWPVAGAINTATIWRGDWTAEALRRRPAPYPPIPDADALDVGWKEECLAEAERLLRNEFSFFALAGRPLGEPIDWNRDYSSGLSAPLDYAPRLDYRDPEKVGDVKYIWELGRMQHLARLGQAWQLTGDERYARAVVAQIDEFIRQCPFMHGIHWTSAMEVSLRLISWTWAFHLIRDWEGLEDEFCGRLINSIDQHLWFVDCHYSLFSSANNHSVAEASGAYFAAAYWTELNKAEGIRRRARRLLERECLRQNWPDGVNKEQAFNYMFFVWDLFVIPGLMGNSRGEEFSGEYWERLEKMAEFLAWVSDCEGNTPNVGDQDDGVAVNLGGDDMHPVNEMLAVAGSLFEREYFRKWSRISDPARAAWMLDAPTCAENEALYYRGSRVFPDGGYHVLRSGGDLNDEVLLLFDAAPLGDPITGVHGHADALSIILHLGGQPFLSDPGTYSYQDTSFRHYFRATAQHNTLSFCDRDQGEYLNRFMWGRRPEVETTNVELNDGGGTVEGRVKWWSGEEHERLIKCDFKNSCIMLRDEWHGGSPAILSFTVSPGVAVKAEGRSGCTLTGDRAILKLECFHARPTIEQMFFSTKCYHRVPTWRIRIEGMQSQGQALTRLSWQWNDARRRASPASQADDTSKEFDPQP